jgi:hypothetical protein
VQQILDQLRPDRIVRERRRYLRTMEWMLGEPIGQRLHLDKNPAYNLMIPVFLRLFPEARLLIALRDPRDVIVSCYLRYLPLNPVSVRFLTIERTAERYALDMLGWLKFRDMIAASWCEIRYEDAVADLEKQVHRALETLGLQWDDRVLSYHDRLRDKPVNSPSYEAVAQPLTTRRVARWRNYEKHLEPVLEILMPFVEAFGYA